MLALQMKISSQQKYNLVSMLRLVVWESSRSAALTLFPLPNDIVKQTYMHIMYLLCRSRLPIAPFFFKATQIS